MTGPQHYRAAEALAEKATDLASTSPSSASAYAAVAQVHATLALAAATAYPAVKDHSGDEDGRESRGWARVTS